MLYNQKVYKDILRIYIIRYKLFLNLSINSEYMSRKNDVKVVKGALSLGKDVETFYEKVITKFGNSAKIDAPKMYIGYRAYVVILKK